MSRPVIRVIAVASVVATVVVFGILALPSKHPLIPAPVDPIPAPLETLDPVAPSPPVESAAAPVPPRSLPTSVALPKARPPVEPVGGEVPDETALLTKLHDLAASDPLLSLNLASEALERFPTSPNAPEFEWNVVKALFNMGRLEDAKDEAQVMLRAYPDSPFTGDVERHLLNTPPNPL